MRTASKEFEDHEKEEARAFQIWDCGSPLYDSCELVSLSHIIERHMMVCPYGGGSKLESITQTAYSDKVIISAKGSSKLSSLIEFLEKIMWKRKVTQEGKGKEHKKIKIGFSGVYCRLVCGGNRILS